jgi:hypothetical protein
MKLTMEEMLDQIELKLHELKTQMERKVTNKKIQYANPENLKKNSHLHIFMETPLHNKLKKEAKEKNISLSELIRWKLRENNQLDRIERKIDTILNRK